MIQEKQSQSLDRDSVYGYSQSTTTNDATHASALGVLEPKENDRRCYEGHGLLLRLGLYDSKQETLLWCFEPNSDPCSHRDSARDTTDAAIERDSLASQLSTVELSQEASTFVPNVLGLVFSQEEWWGRQQQQEQQLLFLLHETNPDQNHADAGVASNLAHPERSLCFSCSWNSNQTATASSPHQPEPTEPATTTATEPQEEHHDIDNIDTNIQGVLSQS